MSFFTLKMNLRAKFTLVLFIVGLIPLLIVSAFFYRTARGAFFNNVFKELKWNVDEISSVNEAHFMETARELLISSNSSAFNMIFREPERRSHWLAEQHKTLHQLRDLYPEVLDEACFIDVTGQEISRIVLGEISLAEELSSEEARTRFFQKAMLLDEGAIYQGRPVVSEDTGRWVIPNATPVFVDGKKVAILHFEIAMNYFQDLLKRFINPERGYGFIIDGTGAFMAHTELEFSDSSPFPRAITDGLPLEVRSIYERMASGESGIDRFFDGAGESFIIFKPIKTSFAGGDNENRWSIAYVLPGDSIYVELDIFRYTLLMIGASFFLTIIIAYLGGNYFTRPIRALAKATHEVADGGAATVDIRTADELGDLGRSFNRMAEAIKKRDEALRELSVTDALTELYNRRRFDEKIESELKRAARFSEPLSLLMIDVDNFKHYNDTNGHTLGDVVLKGVADEMSGSVRGVDFVVRYGGEEFAVILPQTTLAGALEAAERIRRAVTEHDFPNGESQPGGCVSVSIGAAELAPGIVDAKGFVDAADKELFMAKKGGRNRVSPAADRA
jgi:diguanylate cyclase (GGDEF)-like protein